MIYLKNGIKIENYAMLREHFEFAEIYDKVDNGRYELMTLLESIGNSHELKDIGQLDWLYSLLDYKQHEDLLEDHHVFWKELPQEQAMVDKEGALSWLWAWQGLTVYEQPKGYQDDFEQKIGEAIDKLTGNGTVSFTYDEMYHLVMFFCIHILGQQMPSEQTIRYVQKQMYDKNPIGTKSQENSVMFRTHRSAVRDVWRMVWYSGKDNRELPIECISLKNSESVPITIQLEGTVLQRTIPAGGGIDVLKKGEQIVRFLPRFCATNGGILRCEDGWMVYCKGDKEWRQSVEGKSNGFSRAYSCGVLRLDEKGKIDLNLYKGDIYPDSQVVQLCGSEEEYGFLTDKGEYWGIIQKNWEGNLLTFELHGGGSVAIREDRAALDGWGQLLGENVAEITCLGKQFLIIHPDGSMETDQGCPAEPIGPIRGGSITAEGYWVIAPKEIICLKPNNGTLVIYRRLGIQADELASDENGHFLAAMQTNGELLEIIP